MLKSFPLRLFANSLALHKVSFFTSLDWTNVSNLQLVFLVWNTLGITHLWILGCSVGAYICMRFTSIIGSFSCRLVGRSFFFGSFITIVTHCGIHLKI